MSANPWPTAWAPLFDADTRMVVLPDGTSVVQDDLTLNAAGLRRYGDSLLVLGRFVPHRRLRRGPGGSGIPAGGGGTFTCPRTWPTPLDAVTETVLDGEVFYLPGKPLFGKLKMTVDKNLLDAFPDGLTLVACPKVYLADDLTPADVLEHLSLFDCGPHFLQAGAPERRRGCGQRLLPGAAQGGR